MNQVYKKIKQNLVEKKYPFLDLESLRNQYKKEKDNLDFNFSNYIIIGIGGSSQGSKAVSNILNCDNLFFFDHLSSIQIKKTLDAINIESTGFIFISKSGNTSEVLTLFDHLVEKLKDKIDFDKNFLVITEKNDATLFSLADHMGIKIIEHDKNIGGRFSIFSHAGLIPISLFTDKVEQIFQGLKKSIDNFIDNNYEKNEYDPITIANKKYELIKGGKKTSVMLFYGDELVELGNWLKQLFAESLGKKNFGYLPIVSKMTQDQHSLLQLYLDGPEDKFFEVYSSDYNKSDDFINITLSNHKDAMIKTLESEGFPILKIDSYAVEDKNKILSELGYMFSNSILEVLMLAELGGVDPFTQDAVEKQKSFLK